MQATIKRNSSNTQAVSIAQAILKEMGYQLSVDGQFGAGTEAIVIQFQRDNNLVADGIIGFKSWQVLYAHAGDLLEEITSKFLSEADMQQAADALNIELAAVKAVNEVESRGMGFVGELPIFLFERHKFWKRLDAHGLDPHDFEQGNEDILNEKAGGYKGGVKEIPRLDRAKSIHVQAALESASWGLFQIMGFHWKVLGYDSVEDMVTRMQKSEAGQLDGFVRYMQKFDRQRCLQLKGKSELTLGDFANFAHMYNGPVYKKNNYHTKMFNAYNKYRALESQIEGLPLAA